MDVSQVAATMAMQVTHRNSSRGVAGNTPQSGALALVEAEVSGPAAVGGANGMVGSIVDIFA